MAIDGSPGVWMERAAALDYMFLATDLLPKYESLRNAQVESKAASDAAYSQAQVEITVLRTLISDWEHLVTTKDEQLSAESKLRGVLQENNQRLRRHRLIAGVGAFALGTVAILK